MNVFVAGVSHKTAPVKLRERFAVSESQLAGRARELRRHGKLEEVVLLSTCNRVEVYAAPEGPIDDIGSLFALLSSGSTGEKPHLYLHQGVDAMRHLFRVTSGLDSMVPGRNGDHRSDENGL